MHIPLRPQTAPESVKADELHEVVSNEVRVPCGKERISTLHVVWLFFLHPPFVRPSPSRRRGDHLESEPTRVRRARISLVLTALML